MKGYNYIIDNFLNRLSLATLGLTYISRQELLSIPAFSSALYELVYAAAVTGVEEYLKYRLYKEVFFSNECIRKYVIKYNRYQRNKKLKLHISFPLSLEDKEII